MHHGDGLLPARCRADAEGKHLQARKSKTPHRKMLLFSDRAPGRGGSDASLKEHLLPQHTQDASMPQSLHRRATRHGMRDGSPCPFRGSGHRPEGRTHRRGGAGKPREAMGRDRHSQRLPSFSRGLGQPPAKSPRWAWRREAVRRHLLEAARASLLGGEGTGMAGLKAATVKGMPARLLLPCSATRSKMRMFRHQDKA